MSIDSNLNDCWLISTVGGCSPRARSRARSRILHAPWWQTLEVLLYAVVVNDAIKVVMIKWRIRAAVA